MYTLYTLVILHILTCSITITYCLNSVRHRYLSKSLFSFYDALFEGDVVIYSTSDGNTSIGSVIGNRSGDILLAPLCKFLFTYALVLFFRILLFPSAGIRENDELNDETILYEHDTVPSISFKNDNIEILYALNDTIYTQRCIEDRVLNPHGEHAENVWLISSEVIRKLSLDTSFILYKGSGH